MSELSTKITNKIIAAVYKNIRNFTNINRYDIFNNARVAVGEYGRYHDCRDEIDSIIFNIANKFNVNIKKQFVKDSSGNIYVEYVPFKNNGVSKDDSDIFNEQTDNIVCKFSNKSEKCINSNEDSEYYAKIDSQGRIYIPADVRTKFGIAMLYLYTFHDDTHKQIVLNTRDNHNSVINFLNHGLIYVSKTLNLKEGDIVRIYSKDNDTVVIKPL